MKKRIISTVLVIVMLALSLVSCGFSYENSDLSGYASFDKDEFLAELLTLKIEEGGFTGDENVRAQKVLDTIYSTLTGLVDADAKITEGALGARDILYYCYYATAVFGEGDAAETVVVFASKMNASSPTKLQLGTYGAEGVNKKIEDAAKALDDVKDYVYKTNTDKEYTLKYGDKIYVTYNYSYSATEDDGAETVQKGSLAYGELTLTENTSELIDALVGKKLGDTIDDIVTTDEERSDEVTYTDVTVHWVVESGTALTFTDTTYTSTKSEKDTKGTSRDLKDKELTYYVYPVYSLEVPELTALNIIDAVGSSINTVDLDCFSNEDYKYTDGEGKEYTFEELINELATLYGDVATAEKSVTSAEKAVTEKQTAYDKAKAALDKAGESATDAQKKSESDAKKALETAQATLETEQGKLDDAEEAVDAKLDVIFGLSEDMSDVIVADYKDYVYENLEKAYDNENKLALAKEIWAILEEKVTVSSLPEDMVKKAYDRLLENYEYSFNEEMYDSEKSVSNYSQYNGSFESYLIATTGAEDYAGALADVREDAEKYVTPILKLYAAVRAIGEDVIVTDAEFNEYKNGNATYDYYVEYYGEHSMRYAYQFDCLMDYLLETEEVEEGGEEHGNGFKYVRVDFTFKSDEAEDSE